MVVAEATGHRNQQHRNQQHHSQQHHNQQHHSLPLPNDHRKNPFTTALQATVVATAMFHFNSAI
jgi:hypothetical protein